MKICPCTNDGFNSKAPPVEIRGPYLDARLPEAFHGRFMMICTQCWGYKAKSPPSIARYRTIVGARPDLAPEEQETA